MFTIEDFKLNYKWPFSEMKVNDVVYYSWSEDELHAKRAHMAAQSYNSNNRKGIKLISQCLKKNGIKYTVIGRVE